MNVKGLALCLLGAAALLVNTACVGLRATPKLPTALNPDLGTGTMFASKTWFSDYRSQISTLSDDAKKSKRDEYISALKALIDRNYEDYKNKYFSVKSGADFAGDATGILLSGAGTITGGARAKAVLAAVAAATAGLSAKFADIASLQNADGTYSTYPLETAYPVGRLYVDRHEFGDTHR
jgi:hypothetical protein